MFQQPTLLNCGAKVLPFGNVYKKYSAQNKTCNRLIIKRLQVYPAHKC